MPHFQRANNQRALISTFLRGLSVLLALCFFAALPARAQISPGPLTKSHQSLTGTTQCASCHEFGASTPTFKCLACHKEVAARMAANHGYHARLELKNPNGKECVRCHLEHNGVDFPLIHWEPSQKKFDHRLTGYVLDGKHAALACEQCHIPKNMVGSERELIQFKDKSKSFFGLSTACLACHADPHKGQLGNDCQSCHNTTDWKAAKQFDHSKTRYPLTGLHIQVVCEKCHKPDAPGGPARFKDMKFGACSDCHLDPHRGSFKQRCEQCHTTAGWKRLLPGFDFDHSKTKYPLEGKHATVSCAACHLNGDFKKQLAFAACMDCHKDEHNGQFAERAKKGECSECHTVQGWKPSLFGVREHASSKYPLEGKHAAVECAKCHIPAGTQTIYKVQFANCSDCHKDVHDGQFAHAPYNNRCESCHTVRDFHHSLFTLKQHRDTRFALTGAHAAVPCVDCHKPELTHRTDKILPFRFEDRSCTACHADPHHGEFQDRMSRKRPDGAVFGCEACHTSRSWTDVTGFDHSKTKFPLTGAHRSVGCAACHKPQPAATAAQFKGTSQRCEDCHADPHAGQFVSKSGKTLCADCHGTLRWAPSNFDHDKRTQFPLQGGHANVKCERCHTLTKTVGGKEVLFYKPTPVQCAACHGTDPGPLKPSL